VAGGLLHVNMRAGARRRQLIHPSEAGNPSLSPPPEGAAALDALRRRIRDVPDFPKPGILFRDLTPVLADPPLYAQVIDDLVAHTRALGDVTVVGIESRGFLFAAPVAYALRRPLVLVRKPGKLPAATIAEPYGLEYGKDELHAHTDSVKAGDRVVVMDDLLATGGTAEATGKLMTKLGATVASYCFVVELSDLGGRARLGADTVHALLRY
jgi:adenine phosphoribosyltransferase